MTQFVAASPQAPAEAGFFLTIILAFLTPMFLPATNGDLDFARRMALETVNAYRAHNNADLLAIAQIVGFGIAALASLSQSMDDDIPVTLALRLRSSATACTRSAEHLRRALGPNGSAPAPAPVPEPADLQREAEIRATLAENQRRASEAQRRLNPTQAPTRHAPVQPAPIHPAKAQVAPVQPAPTLPAQVQVAPIQPAPIQPAKAQVAPVQPAPTLSAQVQPAPTQPAPVQPAPVQLVQVQPVPAPTVPAQQPPAQQRGFTLTPEEQQIQAAWAATMLDVAGEFIANIDQLPPEERKEAARRAAILNDCANDLLSGNVPPGHQFIDIRDLVQ